MPAASRFCHAALLLGAVIATTACAQTAPPEPSAWTLPATQPRNDAAPAARWPVRLSIVDRETGRTIDQNGHARQWFAAGRPGARYALRLHNPTAQRVLAVLSVDGVNVISGETAAWHQSGYVLEPGSRYDIVGWRKSESHVAAFEFAALSDSYAARTGRLDHVGVIGMAVFLPRAPQVAVTPHAAPTGRVGSLQADRIEAGAAAPASASAAADTSMRAERSAPPSPAAPAPSPSPLAQSAAPQERLGTAHGRVEWSVSTTTMFDRMPEPVAVMALRYDSRENLVAMGVLPPSRPVAQAPQPFPLSPSTVRYVPDPPAR